VRAVWSFWSRPFELYYRHNWGNALNHNLAWVISVNAALAHYPHTMLVTDSAGKRLLVDRLGLPFAEVSTELDRLAGHDPVWWVIGKLVAYSLQTEPFVHIDSDAFLWQRLPEELEATPVLAQHPEHYGAEADIYRPYEIEQAFAASGGIVPVELSWARLRGGNLRADNCGIMGGQHVTFLRHFAETALALIERPENAAGWRNIPEKWRHNYLVEQYLLAVCLDYHRGNADSPLSDVHIRYLFDSWERALNPNEAARVGYTHLMAGAKRADEVVRRMSLRVRRDWPEFYRRCERWSGPP
jgi:hypothetical protein